MVFGLNYLQWPRSIIFYSERSSLVKNERYAVSRLLAKAGFVAEIWVCLFFCTGWWMMSNGNWSHLKQFFHKCMPRSLYSGSIWTSLNWILLIFMFPIVLSIPYSFPLRSLNWTYTGVKTMMSKMATFLTYQSSLRLFSWFIEDCKSLCVLKSGIQLPCLAWPCADLALLFMSTKFKLTVLSCSKFSLHPGPNFFIQLLQTIIIVMKPLFQ